MYESWPPRAERDADLAHVDLPPAVVDDSAPVVMPAGGDEAGGFLSPLQELRVVRESPGTVADHIDYAVNGAYSMPRTRWRDAHVIYAYTAIPVGVLVCRAVEWAFFHRLSRALLAIPVALALLWLLNHLPLLQWLVPDQWDLSTWFAVDAPADPGVVEVPIEPGA